MRKAALGILILFSLSAALPNARADSMCNVLLSGDSLALSIHDLAKLRFDLDVQKASGIYDSITRALEIEYAAREAQMIDVAVRSGVSRPDFEKRLRVEVRHIQDEADLQARAVEWRKGEEGREAHAALTEIQKFGRLNEGSAENVMWTLPDDRVVVVSRSEVHPSVEIIDLKQGTIEKIGDLIEIRGQFGYSVAPDGTAILSGGHSRMGKLSSVERIDPFRRTIEDVGSLYASRYGHTQSLLPDGRIVVFGGYGWSTRNWAQWFQPSTGQRQPIDFAGAGAGMTQSVLPDGRVVLVGGYAGQPLSAVNVIDPDQATLQKIGQLHEPRWKHAQSVFSDGTIWVSGGESFGGRVLSSIERIDPTTGVTQIAGHLRIPRKNHAQSFLPDGRILVSGGEDAEGNPLSSVEVFNPSTRQSLKIGDLADARYSHSQVTLSSGLTVVVGGLGKSSKHLSSIEVIKVGRE